MSETAEGADAPKNDMPVTWADYRAAAALLGIFVVNILLAVIFIQPFSDAGLQAFEDPESAANIWVYVVMILLFTMLILWLAKKNLQRVIQGIILFAVGSTISYVVYPVLFITLGWSFMLSVALSILAGGGSVLWLYKKPEWYVIDLVGVLVAAGAASIFGISIAVRWVVLFLVVLAIYDAIAVYRTKHMLSLADTVIDLRLPVLLVIPKTRGYSFLEEANKFKEASAENKEDREAMFMGLGDLVMPTILVVSALHFGVMDGWGTLPALGAAIGTLVGYGVLMGFVLKGNPQAGLPLLNGGAIVGFLAGMYAGTGSVVFW